MHNPNNPLTLIIFGATGDLYQNKLSLALFNLFSEGFLPSEFRVIGFARRSMTDPEFQSFTEGAIVSHLRRISANYSKTNLNNFLKHFTYIQGDLENLESFKNLSKQLARSDEEKGFCANKLFYLATPPTLYRTIFKNISKAGLTIPCAPSVKKRISAWTRVLVEKPFGKDIKDARYLDRMLGELFDESQIFRIDHYLAKRTLQNIISFRFKNGMSESFWNNKNIERVRVVFHEKDTLFKRGAFYDGVGALRDVGQNHMLAMLALIAMENPKDRSARKIQDARSVVLEKTSLFHNHKINKGVLLRGQYEGYLNEPNVKTDSKTETFFRAVFGVNNKRWQGVPFEMESGKALAQSMVSIEVYFKKVNACLTFYVTSNKGALYDAYEKVFYDCILGDQTLFTNTREIMAQWQLVTNIIKLWQKIPLIIYKKGSNAVDIV